MMALTKDLAKKLHEHLGPIGFRRRGLAWNRRNAATIWVIDLQETKSQGRVWVNLAVVVPSVYRKLWEQEPPAFMAEPDGVVRTRLGPLFSSVDEWWDPSDPLASEDIWNKLRQHGLPFLARMEEPRAIVDFLSTRRGLLPIERLQLAILFMEAGDTPSACSLLEDITRKSKGSWDDRAMALMSELGCSDAGPLAEPVRT